MVDSVQSTSLADISAINQQKIKDFQDGKTNITKSDLNSSVISSRSQGEEVPDILRDIIDSYDKIDTNGDGISYEELETYKNTPQGILSSLGLSPDSLKRKNDSFLLGLLNDNSSSSGSISSGQSSSIGSQPSLLDAGLFNNDSILDNLTSYWDSNSSTSSINKIMQNYIDSKNSDSSNVDLTT